MLSRVLKLCKQRPRDVAAHVRQHALFGLSKALGGLPGFQLRGVSLGPGVRVQRRSSFRVERPDALIRVGEQSVIYESNSFEVYGQGELDIGARVILGGARIVCRESVRIGDGALLSWNIYIQDFDPHPLDATLRELQVKEMIAKLDLWRNVPATASNEEGEALRSWVPPSAPVVIGANVWIGTGVIILKGAVIGENSVVAAGSVVPSGEYPPGSLLAGNPARVVKTLS